MIGKKFGRLIVLKAGDEYKERNSIRRTWICKCDCGNEKEVKEAVLVRNKQPTRSCGCLRNEASKKNTMPVSVNTCEICGKEFEYQSNKVKKTCSDECFNKRRSKYLSDLSRRDYKNFLKHLPAQIKKRCSKYEKETNLDIEYLLDLYDKQNGKCCMTGIEFQISNGSGVAGRSPWSMSIDKINPNGWYTKDNIRLVCLMFNLCKSSWSDEDVMKFAKSLA